MFRISKSNNFKLAHLSFPKLNDYVFKTKEEADKALQGKGSTHSFTLTSTDIKNISLSRMTSQFGDYARVWVVGGYKIGKSTIVNMVSGSMKMHSSDIDNTRGEAYLIDTDKKVIYIDTEGFFQPIDSVDPVFRREFCLEHLRCWSDMVIIVISRLMEHETGLMAQLSYLFRIERRFDKLVIVHNLKTVRTEKMLNEHVQRYKEALNRLYREKGKKGKRKNDKENVVMVQGHLNSSLVERGSRAIHHYFIGNNNVSGIQAANRLTVQDIVKHISAISPPISRYDNALKQSIETITQKYFTSKESKVELVGREDRVSCVSESARSLFDPTTNVMRSLIRWSQSKDGMLVLRFSLQDCMIIAVNMINSYNIQLRCAIQYVSKGKTCLHVENIRLPCNCVIDDNPSVLWNMHGTFAILFKPNVRKHPVKATTDMSTFRDIVLSNYWQDLFDRKSFKEIYNKKMESVLVPAKDDTPKPVQSGNDSSRQIHDEKNLTE